MSTQKVMSEEFERAAKIVDKIVCKQAEWKELFENHDFFGKYRYYLQITANSNNEETQLKWFVDFTFPLTSPD
jgi:poly(A) polymerase